MTTAPTNNNNITDGNAFKLFQITIPPNALPGQNVQVKVGKKLLSVQIPPGTQPGSTLTFAVPIDPSLQQPTLSDQQPQQHQQNPTPINQTMTRDDNIPLAQIAPGFEDKSRFWSNNNNNKAQQQQQLPILVVPAIPTAAAAAATTTTTTPTSPEPFDRIQIYGGQLICGDCGGHCVEGCCCPHCLIARYLVTNGELNECCHTLMCFLTLDLLLLTPCGCYWMAQSIERVNKKWGGNGIDRTWTVIFCLPCTACQFARATDQAFRTHPNQQDCCDCCECCTGGNFCSGGCNGCDCSGCDCNC
jgi:hypothetical protein